MNLRITTSLQTKLILSLLTVVAVSGVGALMVGKAIIDKNIVNQAYESVGQTLEMYGEMYANRLYVKHRLLGTVASYPAFQRDVRSRNKLQVYRVVKELLEETTFDVLNVTDAEGRVLVRSKNYALSGDLVAHDPYVRSVLAHDYPVYGFDVMDREQILRESPELAERAAIPIIPTDRSHDADRTVETRGMFLKVASPIRSNGVLVGVIYGALLLNNDSTFPDRAQTLVFGDQKIDGRDIGTATLFLDDVRISTNVRGKDGKRAFGTLVSREVYDKVFKKGDIWRNKAFVVDRWYIAAYKPVKDLEDKTIGIMYTGVDEAKFGKIQRNATISFVLMIFFSGAVSILLAVYLIHHFISPIGMLVGAAKKITAGQYSRVDIRTDDEMGYLSEMFNSMVDALEEKDRRLMEHVEKQIQQSEKLASLGRLSSGIAHEINNPLTGVLTYSGILMEALRGTEYEEDLKVIQEETLRCRDIVREILDFSRETTLEKEQANLNEIIRDLLGILEKHVAFQNVRVVQDLDPSLPNGLYDINQIKSVINNLAVNAADAMPDGGTITFHTRTSRDGKFAILRVSDTGVGIPEENLPKVFDPFFTTKETGKGTGLGLSVTYGIIKRHQGFIRITSKVGEGTTVDIRLPVRHQEDVS